MMDDTKIVRDRLADCAEIERQLPGWSAKFISVSHNYAARSPDYSERAGRGHIVIGPTPKEVVARVKKGQRLHAYAPSPTRRATPVVISDPAPSPPEDDLPRENTSEEKNNPISNREIARQAGYTGDPCSACGAWTLVRNGTCLKCDSCGATTGCS